MADLFDDLPPEAGTKEKQGDTEENEAAEQPSTFAQQAVAAARQQQSQAKQSKANDAPVTASNEQQQARIAPATLRKKHAGVAPTVTQPHGRQVAAQASAAPMPATPSPAPAQASVPAAASTTTTAGGSTTTAAITEEYVPEKPNSFKEVAEKLRSELGYSHSSSDAHKRKRNEPPEEDDQQTTATNDATATLAGTVEHEKDANGSAHTDDASAVAASVEQQQQEESAEGAEKRKRSGLNAAQRMMEMMGWRAGEGLGKERQGITEPLAVKKHTARSGTIEDRNEPEGLRQQQVQQSQSRIVLLTNTVGRGQVDDELEEDVAQECERFGEVVRCIIFEVAHSVPVPDEQAVRVFVEFNDAHSARECAREMDGRHFGGRSVSAALFDERSYWCNELAPVLNSTAP